MRPTSRLFIHWPAKKGRFRLSTFPFSLFVSAVPKRNRAVLGRWKCTRWTAEPKNLPAINCTTPPPFEMAAKSNLGVACRPLASLQVNEIKRNLPPPPFFLAPFLFETIKRCGHIKIVSAVDELFAFWEPQRLPDGRVWPQKKLAAQ